MTSEGRVQSDGKTYTICPDSRCTGVIRDDGSCTSGHCQSGRVQTPPICWKHLTEHAGWKSCACPCHRHDQASAPARTLSDD